MHFIDEWEPFIGFFTIFLITFSMSKLSIRMDNYLITLGMYLILMLFFKIYFAVAAKD